MNAEAIEFQITEALRQIAHRAGLEGAHPVLEIPRNSEYGDLSSNLAMTTAALVGLKPRVWAEKIAAEFPLSSSGVERVEIAGPSFLNFHLSRRYFLNLLSEILAQPDSFGSADSGRGQRWLFEFVSANPTGPLNIVSARAASVGDALVRIFNKLGYEAHSEFYVNDGGRQVRLLGASLKARLNQIENSALDAEFPVEGYRGEYVFDLARSWREENGDTDPPDDDRVGRWAADKLRDEQERTLSQFRVKFNRWFRESEIYSGKRDQDAIERLRSKEAVYVKDGALFFQASRFGDDEDRVLVKSDGSCTYVVPDIAYHLDKKQRGFDRAVDLLGPDHHGYIDRMRAALKALDLPDDFLQAILVQQVNLKRGGVEVKMSKRAGQMVTLEELIEEVGVDAARFFFLRRRITSPLDFDINLAQRHNDENPVFYVQYAHARIKSILRQPAAEKLISREPDLALLGEAEELDLLRVLARFPWTLTAVARRVDPHPLTGYLIELARAFHLFYTRHRVIGADDSLSCARLALSRGAAEVIRSGLSLIGVEAPEKM
ncbi:MAG: arginine--tRNA ligase [Calditrichota bacterium]